MLQREQSEAAASQAQAGVAEPTSPAASARASPHPRAVPSTPKVKQAQKAVRRSARLVGKA